LLTMSTIQKILVFQGAALHHPEFYPKTVDRAPGLVLGPL